LIFFRRVVEIPAKN